MLLFSWVQELPCQGAAQDDKSQERAVFLRLISFYSKNL